MARVATPLAFKAPVPSVVAPDRNVTVPVGMPPVPVTVAVKVTGVPAIEGVRLLASAVDVTAVRSVSAIDGDVLGR